MANDPFANVPNHEWDDLRGVADAERAKRKPHRKNGGGETFEEGIARTRAETRRFRLVRFSDIKLATSAYYLIARLIPREGIVVVWGPPKCGKSFWTFDALMRVALGWHYRGRRVVPGGVVYVACEGERGLGARAAAFKMKHGVEDSDPNFFLLTTHLDLVTERGQLIRDIQDQIGHTVIVAIVIDTLNRSIIGDENSAQDMGAYLRAADNIRDAFKCAVIIVHHCGVDGTRPRGSSALPGFVEAQLAVAKHDGGLITVTIEYMKDGIEGEAVYSRLEVVEVGKDDDGEPITSCAIVEADPTSVTALKSVKLSAPCTVALTALQQAIIEAGETPPAGNHIPGGVKVVSVELWRRIAYARDISDGETDAKRMAFKRASEQLQARGLVGCWQGFVWPRGRVS